VVGAGEESMQLASARGTGTDEVMRRARAGFNKRGFGDTSAAGVAGPSPRRWQV
jgi:hypothetical protein